ncbi:MAG: hypothetical protein NT003_03910 [Candidatus Magasanikbacteria bacterium]|nr:hypothetical protein [Candidatus Magasanikbacteria bacterium]
MTLIPVFMFLIACSSSAAAPTNDDAANDATDDGFGDGSGDGTLDTIDPNIVLCKTGWKIGDPCTNGNLCQVDAKCDQLGQCTGSPILCNDGNPCTVDQCLDPHTGCDFSKINTGDTCNDGNACTEHDTCSSAGTCNGDKPVLCDDANECTTNTCDTKKGCVFPFNSGAKCNDDNLCTSPDLCLNGLCQAGQATVCNDSNPCTTDLCDTKTGLCVFTPYLGQQPCSDGNACTQNDACEKGDCKAGPPVKCPTSDACTKGSCNSASGDCEYVYVGASTSSCTDGDACTEGDHCIPGAASGSGKCIGTVKSCADGNECTTDSCDPNSGCVNPPDDGATCSDGSKCTDQDKCKQGKCLGIALQCNDGNECTEDTCGQQTGACQFNPLPGKQCLDATVCTKDDICNSNGSCVGSKVSCDDGNPCTSDTCDPVSGCKFQNVNGIPCTGGACTQSDTCQQGVCKVGVNLCDDNNDCTIDKCDSKTATCSNTALVVTLGQAIVCDDSNPCTKLDQCQTGGTCMGSYACDDGKPCTADSCNPSNGTCAHLPITGTPTCP